MTRLNPNAIAFWLFAISLGVAVAILCSVNPVLGGAIGLAIGTFISILSA